LSQAIAGLGARNLGVVLLKQHFALQQWARLDPICHKVARAAGFSARRLLQHGLVEIYSTLIVVRS
jgi:hypothetical protein